MKLLHVLEGSPENEEDLNTAPVFMYSDPNLLYILVTGAIDVGVGTVLSQVQDGEEKYTTYCRKTWAPPEKNYWR